MEAFLVSLSGVAIAEIGDRTQLLALILAARFRKPWPIIAGVLVATLLSHGAAAWIGARLGGLLQPALLSPASAPLNSMIAARLTSAPSFKPLGLGNGPRRRPSARGVSAPA